MRYLPLTEENRNEMLDTIGIEKVDELFSDVPSDIELNPKLNLPPPSGQSDSVGNFDNF